jgi:hypothetical protein
MPESKEKRTARLERVAEVLLEAFVSRDDRKTAQKHGITDRTLRNWRALLFTDPELSELFRSKKARVSEGWADEIPGAMRSTIGFLRKAAEEGDHKNPDMVHSVAGALKLLSEVSATWKLLDARLARTAGPDGAAARPSAAAGTGPAQPN